MSSTLLCELAVIVGSENVRTHGDLSAWEIDHRKRFHGKARAVVFPANTQELAQVVARCAHWKQAIVPQGGQTGLVGGGVPDESGTQLVLSLTRMNRVRAIDVANLSLVAEAGCTLASVHEQAKAQQLLFPLSLASEGQCTIGGNLSTNAGGTQVLRYGNARELCLGLEVVTAQGEIWNGLRGLRKDNSGYDLKQIYIGSEGTLGIITAATLKLFPIPQFTQIIWMLCPHSNAMLELLHLARRQFDSQLTAFEVMESHSLALVARHFPQLTQPFSCEAGTWCVLLEATGCHEDDLATSVEALFAQAMNSGLVTNAVATHNAKQSGQLWRIRECIPLAQSAEGLNVKHDISLPISSIPDCIAEANKAIQQHFPGAQPVIFGHLGDGNLHFNVQAPHGETAAGFLNRAENTINKIVFDIVQARGGSFAAEHGIGQLRISETLQRKQSLHLKLMRQMKLALDPVNILNPGKMVSLDLPPLDRPRPNGNQ